MIQLRFNHIIIMLTVVSGNGYRPGPNRVRTDRSCSRLLAQSMQVLARGSANRRADEIGSSQSRQSPVVLIEVVLSRMRRFLR